MRLTQDGSAPSLLTLPLSSALFEGWSMDELGAYVAHYKARVRADAAAGSCTLNEHVMMNRMVWSACCTSFANTVGRDHTLCADPYMAGGNRTC